MQVQDAQGKTYEIEMASTVLDFAFAVDVQAALHLKAAYVNKSPFPAELDKTLRYGDKVRFEFDENDQNTPQFMWLSFVKTKRAKDHLIAYFYKKFEMQGGM
jgi:(p)ppGpp synthase/HD superfamily hydrolase